MSAGLTSYGVTAMNASVRGEAFDPDAVCQVLSVGLFDGLDAIRVACDAVGFPMAGHISVGCDEAARRVVPGFPVP